MAAFEGDRLVGFARMAWDADDPARLAIVGDPIARRWTQWTYWTYFPANDTPGLVVFLGSDEARQLCGQVLAVGG